ncbi:MAG: DUF4215 domain-containing protein [Nannocystaceae bacterium]|nr:DUF4215 domain-containing protein [bacterium]
MSALLTGCYTGFDDVSGQLGDSPADTEPAHDGDSGGSADPPGPVEPSGGDTGGAETDGDDTGGTWPGVGESGGETTGDEPGPGLCGDGVLDPGEACDLGADNGDGSTCTADCETNVCGDSILGPGETCDDGNVEPSDGCGPTCALESCGDGVKNLGEACDDGQNGDPDDGCTDACALPTCGDGLVQPSIGEQCDDGNGSNTDACTNACQNATCGDGFNGPGEQCDDGNNSNTDSCTNACQNATCGDGFNGPGEQCDDGNNSNTDSCTNACQNATCGDGFNGPGEECDDGDSNDDDTCSNACESQHGGGIPISGYCTPVNNGNWNNSWEDREEEMLTLVNQARSVGRNCGGNFYPAVPPLSYDGSLTCSARNHSRDMAQNDFFSHTGSGGTSPAQRIDMAEYDGSGTSENILAGTVINTAQEALDAWLDSPGHCANIMHPNREELGVGYYRLNGSTYIHYWTQNFGGG